MGHIGIIGTTEYRGRRSLNGEFQIRPAKSDPVISRIRAARFELDGPT